MSFLIKNKIARIVPEASFFLQCDVQTKFKDLIHKMPIIIKNTERMAKTAEILKIPLVVTEQTPDKLGHTFDSIKEVYPKHTEYFEKTTFTMMTPEVKKYVEGLKRQTAVLYGIEAHVCVQQTALDLCEQGYDVHLITDCVSSNSEHKRATAIRRMIQAGVHLSTLESCIYEMMHSSEHEQFRVMLKNVTKDSPSDNFSRV